MTRWLWALGALLVPTLVYATGSLTIPNNIFTQAGGTNVAPLLDTNYNAIANYINAREMSFGLLAARPLAGTAGRFYLATDVNGGTTYVDNGSAWVQIGSGVTSQNINQRASMTLANNGTATATFLVFPGAMTSDDTSFGNRVPITLTTTQTKTLGAWAVGSGNGCLDTGTVAVFTWYHVYVITRLDTGVVDILCSVSGPNSSTSPTMPTNYTKKQRLGAIRTTWFATAGAEIYRFTQMRNRFRWATATADINDGAPGVATSVIATIAVPNGAIVRALTMGLTNAGQMYVSEVNASDQAPGGAAPSGPISCSSPGALGGCQISVVTDPSARIRYINSANVHTQVTTYGWEELWD